MKAFMTTVLALALVVSMAACSSRKEETPSSSSMPSSSMMEESSMMPESSMSASSMMDDLESGMSNAVSNVESAVTPTMSTDFDKIGALGGDQVKWGPGVLVNSETNRTTEPERLQEQYGKYSAYFIAPEDCGKFYLTFDEGYENGYSAQILDILKEKNVQAVFFVTGDYVQREPDLVRRMIEEGHIVGNHTNKHKNPTQITIEEAYEDIQKLHDYVKETFDYEMYLYRPPEGAFSEKTLAMAQEAGYSTCLWSFAYKDYDPNDQMGHDPALARTEKFIHEGAIYLLHAVSADNTSLLGELIDEVRGRGLNIVPWDLAFVSPEN